MNITFVNLFICNFLLVSILLIIERDWLVSSGLPYLDNSIIFAQAPAYIMLGEAFSLHYEINFNENSYGSILQAEFVWYLSKA